MSAAVRFATSAVEDLERLMDFLLERARSEEDLEHAMQMLVRLDEMITGHLSAAPFSYRKAGDGRLSMRRELIIASGATGYVVLYEIESPVSVVVLAVRHQREDDYH